MAVRPSLGSQAKVVSPALPPRLIERGRLFDALSAASAGPLTLISAGPGWGKSVLLSSWAHSSRDPIAWLSLEPADNDPERFWQLFGEALQAAGLVGDADAFSSLPHCTGSPSAFIRALLDAIPESARLVVVLDDAHLLTDSIVLAELDALIRYGFAAIGLVMAARSDPLLPLHRYRLAYQMRELRAVDLAMTGPETEALLLAHGIALPPADLDRLTDRTEGWTAGVRLSAMSMSGSAHPERFVSQLALDRGSVGEYLMEEVLDRQPEQVRRLLIETSFLDEVSGELAAAVTGIADSPAILAELVRTNSFVVPLDRSGRRFRYHQLMTEILSYMLKREPASDLGVLRLRAARWYDANGAPAQAMRFALQGDDWAHACEVLIRGGYARAFVEREDLGAIGLLRLSAMSTDHAQPPAARSDLLIAQAAIAAAAGDLEVAAARLVSARAGVLSGDAAATAAIVEAVAAHHCSSIAAADAAADALLAEPVEGAVRSVAGLTAALRVGQASTRFWQGRPHAEVEQFLAQALVAARVAGNGAIELECLGLMQLAYVANGRMEHAKECESLVDALLRGAPTLKRMTVNHLATASDAFTRGDPATAGRAIRRAKQMASPSTPAALRAGVALMDARVRIMRNHLADAYQGLLSAPELRVPLPAVLTSEIQLVRADLETRLGRPHAALKSIASAARDSGDPLAAVVSARAYVALADPLQARQALRPALNSASSRPGLPTLIEALLVSAKVAEMKGFEAKAVAETLRAIALGAGAITQPFADARGSLSALLTRHPQAAQAWPTSVGEPEPEPEGRIGIPAQALFEALTERETAVLRRLATTMTSAEIAAELHVSINTVKTHIAAVYRKLPAGSRRDAVARARELELL